MKRELMFLFVSLLVVTVIFISAQYVTHNGVVTKNKTPQVIGNSTLLYYLEKNQKEPLMTISKYFDGNQTVNPAGRNVTVFIEVVDSSASVNLILENALTQVNYFGSEISINNGNKLFIVPKGDWTLYMINHNSFSLEVKVEFYLPDW